MRKQFSASNAPILFFILFPQIFQSSAVWGVLMWLLELLQFCPFSSVLLSRRIAGLHADTFACCPRLPVTCIDNDGMQNESIIALHLTGSTLFFYSLSPILSFLSLSPLSPSLSLSLSPSSFSLREVASQPAQFIMCLYC